MTMHRNGTESVMGTSAGPTEPGSGRSQPAQTDTPSQGGDDESGAVGRDGAFSGVMLAGLMAVVGAAVL